MASKIVRNLIIIGLIAAVCIAIVLVGIFSSALINWIKTGWTYLLTIALTSVACAIIFGITDKHDAKNDDATEDRENDEKPMTPWTTK